VAALAGRAVIVYGILGAWRLARRAWRARSGGSAADASRAGTGAVEAVQIAAADGPATATPTAKPKARGKPRPARDEGAFPFDWLHVIFWSGLRGAVSTALALSLPIDFPDRSELQGIVFGVVLFTLLVQATTADLVVGRWGRKVKEAPRTGGSAAPGRSRGRKVDRPALERAGAEADSGSST